MIANNEPQAQPVEQCQGWWIPIKIIRLLQAGEINSRELILLAIIDSLVDEKHGCFASNAYLADKTHCSETTIRTMLTKFYRLELVTKIRFDGRTRILETRWSRSNRMSARNQGVSKPETKELASPKPGGILLKLNKKYNTGPKGPCAEPGPSAPHSALSQYVFPVKGRGGGSKKTKWILSINKLEEYEEAFPDIDIPKEMRKAVQWCRDNPRKRKTAGRGMKSFLTAWLNRVQNNGRGVFKNGGLGEQDFDGPDKIGVRYVE